MRDTIQPRGAGHPDRTRQRRHRHADRCITITPYRALLLLLLLLPMVGCSGTRSPEETEQAIREGIRSLLDSEQLEALRIQQLTVESSPESKDVSGSVGLVDERSRVYDLRFRGYWEGQRLKVSMELPRLRHLEQQAAETVQASLRANWDESYEVKSLILRRYHQQPDHYFGLAEVVGPDGSDQCQVDLQVTDETHFQIQSKPLQVRSLLENLRDRLVTVLAEQGWKEPAVRFGDVVYEGNDQLIVFGLATEPSGTQARMQVELQLLQGGQYRMELTFLESRGNSE